MNRIVTAPLIALSLLACPAVLIAAETETAAQVAEPQAPAVIVIAAEEQGIADRVLATGTLTAVEEILVQPQIEGLAIESLGADVGDRVQEGQVLATLSKDQLILQKSQLLATRAKANAAIAQLNAQLTEVQSNAGEAQKAADRARTLAKQGTFTRVQAEQAEAQAVAASARVTSVEEAIKVAQADIAVVDAQVNDVDLRLARTEVKASAGGVVSQRAARVGQIASAAGGPLFTLIRDGELELRADLAETDVVQVAPGQNVSVRFAGLNHTVEGTVHSVDPTLNAQTRLGLARIRLNNADDLKAGMFAEATILIAERNAIAVPVTAVRSGKDGASVLRVTDGRASLVPVRTGIREAGKLEIIEGLQEGDLIVAKAGAFIRDGDRVNPVFETENGRKSAMTE